MISTISLSIISATISTSCRSRNYSIISTFWKTKSSLKKSIQLYWLLGWKCIWNSMIKNPV